MKTADQRLGLRSWRLFLDQLIMALRATTGE
jgi:hypothetical protein